MKPNLDGRVFRTAETTTNGEVGTETVFRYHQNDRMVWAEYSGGEVVTGHLLAVIADDNTLDMRYHHINCRGDVLAGTCRSSVRELPDGRYILEEEWQWLTGDRSAGRSRVEEVPSPGEEFVSIAQENAGESASDYRFDRDEIHRRE